MEGISPFQSGRPLLSELNADKLNKILAELKRNRPVVAAPLTARVTGDGTHISIKIPPRGAGTPATAHPFQIRSRQNENQYLATVHPGTINALLPTNILSGSSLTEHAYPKDQSRYVVLTGTSNGTQMTGAEISLESSAPEAQTPALFSVPTTVKILIGIVRNEQIFQIVFDNIVFSGKQHFTKDKNSAAPPGFLPYEIYFVWG